MGNPETHAKTNKAKYTTQNNKKLSNTDTPKSRPLYQLLAKCKQFQFIILRKRKNNNCHLINVYFILVNQFVKTTLIFCDFNLGATYITILGTSHRIMYEMCCINSIHWLTIEKVMSSRLS